MHEELWQQLISLDRRETAQRAKCQYVPDFDSYNIVLLNREYVVNLAEKQVFPAQSGSEPAAAEFLPQLCILAYLINAKELPLAKKFVRAESLPGGEFFFRGPHVLPTQKLAQFFGEDPNLLYQAGVHMDAEKRDFKDASVELSLLPRVPVTFVVWAGDDEFEARASILFDKNASEQLPLDALLAAVNLAVDAITSVKKDS